MIIETADGILYQMHQRGSGFFNLDGDHDYVIAFVGDKRIRLCEDLMSGRRKLVAVPEGPSGVPALGFSESNYTLVPCNPIEGYRMMIFNKRDHMKPLDLTAEIKRIQY